MTLCSAFLEDDHHNPRCSLVNFNDACGEWRMPSPKGEKEFVPLECSQSGCGFSPIDLAFFLRKARPHDCRRGGMLLNGGDAYPPVLLQFVPCAF